MDTQTRDEVFTLAALGREYGLDRAVKWIMAHMAEAERGRKRRKRKVKVRLERGGKFWLEEALLTRSRGV